MKKNCLQRTGSWYCHRKEFKDVLNTPSKQNQACSGFIKGKKGSPLPKEWDWAGQEEGNSPKNTEAQDFIRMRALNI